MRGALTLVALLALVAPVRAEDGCGAIGWSVKRDLGWFAKKELPRRQSGVRLKEIDGAVDLTLKPVKQVVFFLPPTTPAKAGSYAGEITFFGVPRPGMYQVTLSQTADVDVFENGMRITPAAMARAPDCADARISARYALQTGDLVLVQISNVSATSIKVAFSLVQ